MEVNIEPEYESEYDSLFSGRATSKKNKKEWKGEILTDLPCGRCAAFPNQQAEISQELKESFLRREYTVRREVISIPPARANRGANEDYTGISLSCALICLCGEV